MPHRIFRGDACFAYFNKIWGIPEGRTPQGVETEARANLMKAKSPPTEQQRNVKAAEISLTRGQVNAVRAAFKAGITPSRIARQFGISQSNVRKALASDESRSQTI